MMSKDIMTQSAEFIKGVANQTQPSAIRIIFHGGEPLLLPLDRWRFLLTSLCESLTDYPLSFSVQSNLWRFDEEYAQLFAKFHVHVASSLDGPEIICDAQRGDGYFQKTMAGIRLAQRYGLLSGVIATITDQSKDQVQEVVNFFDKEELSVLLHEAQTGKRPGAESYTINPKDFGEALLRVLPWYVDDAQHIFIRNYHQFASGLLRGNPRVCSLRDCLGMFLAIAPDGNISSCQRFAGLREYVLGNVRSKPSLEQLFDSEPALRQKDREERVRKECAECGFVHICHGGCYHNAVFAGDGIIDPQCVSIRMIYSYLQEKMLDELTAQCEPKYRQLGMR